MTTKTPNQQEQIQNTEAVWLVYYIFYFIFLISVKGDSHFKDESFIRPSYPYNENYFIGKTTYSFVSNWHLASTFWVMLL